MAVAADSHSLPRSRRRSPVVAVIVAARVDAEVDRSCCFVRDNHLNARAHALFAGKVSEIILRDLGGRP